jgi:hypothetical protein
LLHLSRGGGEQRLFHAVPGYVLHTSFLQSVRRVRQNLENTMFECLRSRPTPLRMLAESSDLKRCLLSYTPSFAL